jgi:hypothetical protein
MACNLRFPGSETRYLDSETRYYAAKPDIQIGICEGREGLNSNFLFRLRVRERMGTPDGEKRLEIDPPVIANNP